MGRNELWPVVKSRQQTLQSTAAAARPFLDKLLDTTKPTCILQKSTKRCVVANGCPKVLHMANSYRDTISMIESEGNLKCNTPQMRADGNNEERGLELRWT
jgi:hypothetical protein